MRQILLTAVLPALALLALATPAGAAKFYKWVDKNGVTHYDATPPKDHETTEVRAANRPATAVTPAAATDEAAADPAAATAAAAPSTADPQACESARANLQTLQSNTTITRVDEATKQSVKLSQAEIDAAYAQAEQDIARFCEQAAG